MKRLENVSIAVKLLYLALFLGILSLIINASELLEIMSLGFFYYLLIFTYGFYFYIVYKIGEGKNWARITYLVLFIIGICLVVFSPTLNMLGSIVLILEIIALILLFGNKSSKWFKRMSKKTTKKGEEWYKTWWAILLFVFAGIIVISIIYGYVSYTSSPEYQVKTILEEKGYEVIAVSLERHLEMKASGDRATQVWDGIMALYSVYPHTTIGYFVYIETSEKTCSYLTMLTNFDDYVRHLDGEVILIDEGGRLGPYPNFPQHIAYLNRKFNENIRLGYYPVVDGSTLRRIVHYQIMSTENCESSYF